MRRGPRNPGEPKSPKPGPARVLVVVTHEVLDWSKDNQLPQDKLARLRLLRKQSSHLLRTWYDREIVAEVNLRRRQKRVASKQE